MKRFPIAVATLFAFAITTVTPLIASEMGATGDDGRRVILKDDHTWIPEPPKKSTSKGTTFSKSEKAKSYLPLRGEKFGIWYDPDKWIQAPSDDSNKVQLNHKDGDVYAMIFAERIGMTVEGLKDIAIKNARKVSPNIEVTFEEKRVVNGVEILAMKMQGVIQGIEFVYYSYYYASKGGTIQCITYTSSGLFGEYEKALTDFLNGLTIKE